MMMLTDNIVVLCTSVTMYVCSVNTNQCVCALVRDVHTIDFAYVVLTLLRVISYTLSRGVPDAFFPTGSGTE